MRVAASVLSLTAILGGCAAEDGRPLRPPGGGNNLDDAGAGADSGGGPDAEGGLRGVVCLVDDLTDLHACPTSGLRADVLVEDLAGTVSTRSGSNGTFTLDLPGPSETLRLGADGPQLVETLVDVVLGDAVAAQVMERTEYEGMLALLGIGLDSTGAVVVEVIDGAGAPVQGATVTITGGSDFAIVYDAPGGAWDDAQLGTGPLGLAFVPGVLPGARTVGASAGDLVGTDPITCAAGAVSFARVRAQ